MKYLLNCFIQFLKYIMIDHKLIMMVDVYRAADRTLHMRECPFIISIYRTESRRG